VNRQQRRAAGNHKDKSQLAKSIESTRVMIKAFEDRLDGMDEKIKNVYEYVEETIGVEETPPDLKADAEAAEKAETEQMDI